MHNFCMKLEFYSALRFKFIEARVGMEDANTIPAKTRITLNEICGHFTSVAELVNYIPCQKVVQGQFLTVQKYSQSGSGNGWILEVNELDVIAII